MLVLTTRQIQIVGGVLAVVLLLPVLIHAQTTSSSALDATIRAAIMQDPRSASLSAAQINAMVSALSAQAQTKGLTAQNIAYRPGTPGISVPGATTNTPTVSDPCSLSSSCAVGKFLGSGIGRNVTYAAFWILSLLLIAIVWHMRKNPHLMKIQKVHDTPAIGGGI